MHARSKALALRRQKWHDLFVKDRYKTGASTKHRLLVHLVFCPKYRRRVLRGKVVERLYELFYDCCQINDWIIQELNMQKDHVHLLIQINPRDSVAHVLHYLKGGSSRILRKEFPELLKMPALWTRSYFVSTAGKVSQFVIRKYIEDQYKR